MSANIEINDQFLIYSQPLLRLPSKAKLCISTLQSPCCSLRHSTESLQQTPQGIQKKMWNYADMTDPSLHLLRPYIWNCVIQQIMSRVLGTDGSRNVKWHQARYAQPMSLWALGTSSWNDGYEQLTSRHRAFRAHVAQFILPILLHAIAKCVDGDVHSPRLQMAVGDCCPSIHGQNTGYELVYTSKLRINSRHATGFMPSPGAGWSKGFVIFLNRSGNLLK